MVDGRRGQDTEDASVGRTCGEVRELGVGGKVRNTYWLTTEASETWAFVVVVLNDVELHRYPIADRDGRGLTLNEDCHARRGAVGDHT